MFSIDAIPEGRTFMELFAMGLISTKTEDAYVPATVFQGKEYTGYSLAVLFTMRKYLQLVVKETQRGIPGVAVYGVNPQVWDELRAVEQSILRRQFDL